nr:hypothetical protein [Chlamydiota bacterium]
QIVPNQPKQSSLLWTATKVVVSVGALVAFGYGMYLLGVQKASETAGIGFENFIQDTANMSSQEREAFYASIRQTGMITEITTESGESIPLLNIINGAITTYLPDDVNSILRQGVGTVTTFIGLGEKVTFNGKVASQFAEGVRKSTAGLFNATMPGTETLEAVKEMGSDLYNTGKWAILGVGVAGGLGILNQGFNLVNNVAKSPLGKVTSNVLWYGGKAIAYPFSKKMTQ